MTLLLFLGLSGTSVHNETIPETEEVDFEEGYEEEDYDEMINDSDGEVDMNEFFKDCKQPKKRILRP